MKQIKKFPAGFTLIEICAVFVLLVVISGVLLSNISSSRDTIQAGLTSTNTPVGRYITARNDALDRLHDMLSTTNQHATVQ